MDDLRKIVGRRLKERRIKKGYKSQKAFGEALGTDQSTVGRWEAGLFLPAPEYRERIYKLLDTDQIDLFGLEVETPPSPPTQSAMAQTIGLLQAEIDELKKRLPPENISETHRKLLAIIPTLPEARVRTFLSLIEAAQKDEARLGVGSPKRG